MTNIQYLNGDITKLEVDAIVNAANTSLLGGGGVDGAIHKAAGPKLLEECKKLNGCETGQSKITKGYNLPAKFVIHTVGPVWQGGDKNERTLLKSCYETVLNLAKENGIKTIAFPAISCGIYGFPLDEACKIAMETVKNFIKENDFLEKVIFVEIDKSKYLDMYRELLAEWFKVNQEQITLFEQGDMRIRAFFCKDSIYKGSDKHLKFEIDSYYTLKGFWGDEDYYQHYIVVLEPDLYKFLDILSKNQKNKPILSCVKDNFHSDSVDLDVIDFCNRNGIAFFYYDRIGGNVYSTDKEKMKQTIKMLKKILKEARDRKYKRH